jgi:hypothetical protein
MDAPVILAVDEDPDALRNIVPPLAEGAVAIQLLHRLFASEPQHPPDPSPERLAIVGL